MDTIYVLGAFIIIAYLLQVVFALRQIKHFNQIYLAMRKKGRVAIGRKSGRVRAGTIVLFAVDEKGCVLDARKMQGVTVAARCKQLPAYVGQDIHYLDHYHPLVRAENSLLQRAIEDARDVFVRSEIGNNQDVANTVPMLNMMDQVHLFYERVKYQFKKGTLK